MHTYIYIYLHVCIVLYLYIHTYVYIYIYIHVMVIYHQQCCICSRLKMGGRSPIYINLWPWPDKEKGSTNGSSILDILGRHVPSSNLLQFAIGHSHFEIADLPINNINSMVMFQFVMLLYQRVIHLLTMIYLSHQISIEIPCKRLPEATPSKR